MKTLFSSLIIAMVLMPLAAQEVRPVKDDVGFCWNAASMKTLVDYLEAREKETFRTGGLVAAISPHDDYLYAGRIYYPLFKILRAKEVVIFGVTHGAVRKEIGDPQGILILDEFKLWPGPAKPIEVSGLREYLKARLDKGLFMVSNKAHELEHSIEALLPFLQYFNPDVKITPIMVAPMPYARMEEVSTKLAAIIAAYMKENRLAAGKDIAFLISSDGNHYGQDFNNSPFGEGQKAWETALALDRRLIADHLTGTMDDAKVEGLTKELWGKTYLDYRNTYWCGKYSIPFGLLAARKTIALDSGKKINGTLFRYSDTYSEGALPLTKLGMGTTAPFSLRHWVSFCSIGYYLE
jgi:AmmeMemoRadiSam system protein B